VIDEIIRRMKAVSTSPETAYVVEAPISNERFYNRLLRAMLAEGINQCFITVIFDPNQVEALLVRSMNESELADCEQENIENLTGAILERLNALEACSGQHFLVTHPDIGIEFSRRLFRTMNLTLIIEGHTEQSKSDLI
jgi:hypothetical protein